ncbi:hypothetical protein CW745_03490 [Psychromonas sp. psych-6C06]|uniref:vWA domain-containing protein n=1 Tax=Psychromonas sp. psych-6C06 TaxID=2058089 RepID=UPI000C33C6BB|nr:VWA domain-containing protein [Psychromonas sp. psych-6C06]PKF62509.1 hypothetical protein CW745_03490 [Psychromonas sp. psych-6C06]
MFDNTFINLLWTNFHFIRPQVLLLLLPFSAIIYLRWQRVQAATSQQHLPPHLQKVLTVGEQGWRKMLPLKILSLLLLLTIISSAGPTWTRAESPFNEDKGALVVIVDLSESMLENDIAPNRLIRAQHKIIDLIEQRDGGKTALIAYAGSAHVVMPLTSDKQVFMPFVSALSPEIMPREGKQAEQALPLVDRLLSDEKSASILLISDGMPPETISAYEQYFDQSDHQLLLLGVGDNKREATIPFDLRSLQNLADKTNASLHLLSIDNQDIKWLLRQIQRHIQISSDSIMPWQDMGYYLLFPIALLLLLWFRKGWLVQWSLLLIISANAVMLPSTSYASQVQQSAQLEQSLWSEGKQFWSNLWLTPDQQGERAFQNKDYLSAAQHYQDPLRKGIAYYYAAQFKAAHISFMQQPTDLSLFYASNALARQREYIAARNLLVDLDKKMEQEHLTSQLALHTKVRNNLQAIQAIIDDINRYSESQKGTTDGLEESFEVGKDDPITSDGYDEISPEEVLNKETLNAREILGSEALADKWLKRVQADPKRFLQAKFYLQHQAQEQ